MNIGIDARLIKETGVGRYIRNLIAQLVVIDKTNTYVVFVRHEGDFDPPNTRWVRRVANVPWHSVAEQIHMPGIFSQEKLDLLHVPYFNFPLFYFGKTILTVHDLTIYHFDTGKASTHPYLLYKIRRLLYLLLMNAGLARASRVIAVSKATKQEICNHFDILPEHISVIYEG